MRLVAISDVHEQWNSLALPDGDVLVVAGDLCERNDKSFAAADAWFASVATRFATAVYVPGNHDQSIVEQPRKYRTLARNLLRCMLVDETIVVDGLKFHGMPWETRGREQPESRIPSGLDVLVTHEPAYGIRDWAPQGRDTHVGNRALRGRLESVAPRLHVFGHCHMAYGADRRGGTTHVNVAICGQANKYYGAAHPATVIDIASGAGKIEVVQWRLSEGARRSWAE